MIKVSLSARGQRCPASENGRRSHFGIAGDGINSIIEALRSVRTLFAILRCGMTWRLGITGQGAIHLMNGLYDAAFDGAPVVALTAVDVSQSSRRPLPAKRGCCEADGAVDQTQRLNNIRVAARVGTRPEFGCDT